MRFASKRAFILLAMMTGAALWLGAQRVLASSGSGSDGSPEDHVEDQIEDQVDAEAEAQVEESVEDSVETEVESAVEDQVEASVEDNVETQVEDGVEDSVESDVEDTAEASVEGKVEDAVESDVEDSVEDEVEGDVEDDVEGGVEEEVEDSVENKIEDKIDDRINGEDGSDKALDREVEDAETEHASARMTESSGEDDAEERHFGSSDSGSGSDDDFAPEEDNNSGDNNVEENEDDSGSGSDDDGDEITGEESENEDDGEDQANGSGDDDNEAESGGEEHENEDESSEDEASESETGDDDSVSADEVGDRFEIAYDEDGNEIGEGEWLILAPSDAIGALIEEGYVAYEVQSLDGLGLSLVRLEAPKSFSIAEAEARIRAAAPDAEVDYNHVYHTNAASKQSVPTGERPDRLFKMPKGERGDGHAIGVIDTGVDVAHPALQKANIQARSFVGAGGAEPMDHGTSVVSILAGDASDYHGLLPHAKIFAASVFFTTPDSVDSATTVGLVRALDWMTVNDVPIVNMSLTGPDNAVLHGAIERAYAKGTVVVAAVGNEGPAAKPLYPAAYDHVVAVTAVSQAKTVYRLANRGDFVDFSAPGVDVMHAAENGGFASSSGTSMASPFVAAALSASLHSGEHLSESTLAEFADDAEDLGAKGFDPIYGNGLIRLRKD